MALMRADRLSGMSRLFEHITVVESIAEQDGMVCELGCSSGPLVVSFINAHAVNLAWSNPAFRDALTGSDVLLRDGIGMAIAMPWLGLQPGLNLNGTDLIPDLLRRYARRRIALAGSTPVCVEEAAAQLRARYGCTVVATMDGFSPISAYVTWAQSHKPDIIVLGMGMPKQECVAITLRASLSHPSLIINGGAVLDFLAGQVRRAPVWVRAARMEWIYRLGLEPRRLWRRYIVGNPLFLLRAFRLSVWRRIAGGP